MADFDVFDTSLLDRDDTPPAGAPLVLGPKTLSKSIVIGDQVFAEEFDVSAVEIDTVARSIRENNEFVNIVGAYFMIRTGKSNCEFLSNVPCSSKALMEFVRTLNVLSSNVLETATVDIRRYSHEIAYKLRYAHGATELAAALSAVKPAPVEYVSPTPLIRLAASLVGSEHSYRWAHDPNMLPHQTGLVIRNPDLGDLEIEVDTLGLHTIASGAQAFLANFNDAYGKAYEYIELSGPASALALLMASRYKLHRASGNYELVPMAELPRIAAKWILDTDSSVCSKVSAVIGAKLASGDLPMPSNLPISSNPLLAWEYVISRISADPIFKGFAPDSGITKTLAARRARLVGDLVTLCNSLTNLRACDFKGVVSTGEVLTAGRIFSIGRSTSRPVICGVRLTFENRIMRVSLAWVALPPLSPTRYPTSLIAFSLPVPPRLFTLLGSVIPIIGIMRSFSMPLAPR